MTEPSICQKFIDKPVRIFITDPQGKQLIFTGLIIYVNLEKETLDFLDRYKCIYTWPCSNVRSIRPQEVTA